MVDGNHRDDVGICIYVADVIAFECNGRCYCHIYIYIALTECAYNSGKG